MARQQIDFAKDQPYFLRRSGFRRSRWAKHGGADARRRLLLLAAALVNFGRNRKPGETITGIVASTAPATRSQFNVLPAENTTGNFTKIVQRVPVRILR